MSAGVGRVKGTRPGIAGQGRGRGLGGAVIPSGYAAPGPDQAAAEAPRPADAGLAGARAAVPGPAGSAGSAEGGAADGGAGTQRIQAVDRAVALLKSVAASATPPTVLALPRDRGINRSTAWRLLRRLGHHAPVDRRPSTQRYTVGYRAISVAAAVTDRALVPPVR